MPAVDEKRYPSEEGIKLGERIAKVADIVGGKRALAEKANVKESQLYRYIKGINIPSVHVVVEIAEAGDVDVSWLATGEGPMMRVEAEKARHSPRPKYDMFFDKELLTAAIFYEEFFDILKAHEDPSLSEEENEQKIYKIIREKVEKITFNYTLFFYGGVLERGDTFEEIKKKMGRLVGVGSSGKICEELGSKEGED
jgi:transcriptional regulator with XRE-family HTH domain